MGAKASCTTNAVAAPSTSPHRTASPLLPGWPVDHRKVTAPGLRNNIVGQAVGAVSDPGR